MRTASRGPSPSTATTLTGIGNGADTEHALDSLPVSSAVRRHGTARERALEVAELHDRRERLATVVGEEEAVSVPEEVATGVDPHRLAETLPQAAQMGNGPQLEDVAPARRHHLDLAATRP